MEIPNRLLDHNSGAYIDLTHFELFFSFIISKIDSTEPITGNGNTNLFELVEHTGSIKQRSNSLLYTYLMTQSVKNKHIKFGCVPSECGTFNGAIGFPNLFINKDQTTNEALEISDPDCEETLTSYSKISINHKDINYHMLEGTCRYTLAGERRCYGPVTELPMYSLYAFHVKEP